MNRAANISPLCRPRRPTAPHAGLRPVAAAFVLAIATASAHAQPLPAEATPREPVVTVSASASAGVANDRLRASLRGEAEHASAATAAAEVNGRIAKALARAKGATNWLLVKRLLWLGVFGLIHYFFIWRGDILFGYAFIHF